jgi:hypothetical protein
MRCYLAVPLDPQKLFYGDTLECSSSIIRRYSQVLICYYMKVRLASHVPLFEGILRSCCAIIWRYAQVFMCYYFEVPSDPDVPLLGIPWGRHLLVYEGIIRSWYAIIWGYL